MTLSARDRRRYARQLSLPEIGEAGQERLCAASLGSVLSPTAREYLRRAGVGRLETETDMATAEWSPHVQDHDAAIMEGEGAVLAAAWEAVERIKEILGVGVKGTLE